MKNEVGLWIDHRKTVLVFVTDEREETRVISSEMEKVGMSVVSLKG